MNAPIKILRWSNGVFFDPARSMSDRNCWRPYRTGLHARRHSHNAGELVPAFATCVYMEFISLTSIFTSP
jgi:hypothetical protein